jgi:RNA polymerase sigma-70 factor (ECF subfamily)
MYCRIVLRTARNYITDQESAMDVMHDTFIKIFRNFREIEDQAAMESWVRTVTINTAIDALRRLKKLKYLEESFQEPEISEENSYGRLAVKDLFTSINSLPEGARCVLNLYAIEGYNHKEIAQIMNISEGTSKSQLSRARKLLEVVLRSIDKA